MIVLEDISGARLYLISISHMLGGIIDQFITWLILEIISFTTITTTRPGKRSDPFWEQELRACQRVPPNFRDH